MEIPMMTVKTAAPTAGAGQATGNGGQASGETGKSNFAGALVAIIGGQGQNGAKADEASLSLNALLQGLSPALLALLLPQLQDTGSESATAQLLDAIAANPELLAQLLANPGFQQWLQQANELLQASGVDTGVAALQGDPGAAGNAGAAALNSAQAQQIMAAFAGAMKQNPDSILFQQLAQSFGETFAQSLLQQEAAIGTATANNAAATGTATPPVANGRTKEAAKANALPSAPVQIVSQQHAGAEKAELPQQLQQLVAHVQTTKLDLLSAKHAMQRMMLAAQSPTESAAAESNADAASLPTLMPLQTGDLIRSLQQGFAAKPAGETIGSQSFVQDMSQFMIKAIKVNPLNGFSEARLSLTPESLGHVEVKITMQAGQLVAQFHAQTALGKEMIEGQLAQLRTTLQNQGIHVERLEVTQQNNLQSGMFQDQQRQQSSQQPGGQGKSSHSEIDTGAAEFAQELTQVAEARNGESSGSVFDVTA
ncbi:MAG: flagellar hook-length control protein FliK [Paenibacillaceae bacterium]|nr:flagellar hook-length control protein FliK [Paenibacillaceae bacterium]